MINIGALVKKFTQTCCDEEDRLASLTFKSQILLHTSIGNIVNAFLLLSKLLISVYPSKKTAGSKLVRHMCSICLSAEPHLEYESADPSLQG